MVDELDHFLKRLQTGGTPEDSTYPSLTPDQQLQATRLLESVLTPLISSFERFTEDAHYEEKVRLIRRLNDPDETNQLRDTLLAKAKNAAMMELGFKRASSSRPKPIHTDRSLLLDIILDPQNNKLREAYKKNYSDNADIVFPLLDNPQSEYHIDNIKRRLADLINPAQKVNDQPQRSPAATGDEGLRSRPKARKDKTATDALKKWGPWIGTGLAAAGLAGIVANQGGPDAKAPDRAANRSAEKDEGVPPPVKKAAPRPFNDAPPAEAPENPPVVAQNAPEKEAPAPRRIEADEPNPLLAPDDNMPAAPGGIANAEANRPDPSKNPRTMNQRERNQFALEILKSPLVNSPSIGRTLAALQIDINNLKPDQKIEGLYPIPAAEHNRLVRDQLPVEEKQSDGGLFIIRLTSKIKSPDRLQKVSLDLPVLMGSKATAIIKDGFFVQPKTSKTGDSVLEDDGKPYQAIARADNLAALPIVASDAFLNQSGKTVDTTFHKMPHIDKPILTIIGNMPVLKVMGATSPGSNTTVNFLPDDSVALRLLSEKPVKNFNPGTFAAPRVKLPEEVILCGVPGEENKKDEHFILITEGNAVAGESRSSEADPNTENRLSDSRNAGLTLIRDGIKQGPTLTMQHILPANISPRRPGSLQLHAISTTQKIPTKVTEVQFGDSATLGVPGLRELFAPETQRTPAMEAIAQEGLRRLYAKAFHYLLGMESLDVKRRGLRSNGALGRATNTLHLDLANGIVLPGEHFVQITGGDLKTEINPSFEARMQAADKHLLEIRAGQASTYRPVDRGPALIRTPEGRQENVPPPPRPAEEDAQKGAREALKKKGINSRKKSPKKGVSLLEESIDLSPPWAAQEKSLPVSAGLSDSQQIASGISHDDDTARQLLNSLADNSTVRRILNPEANKGYTGRILKKDPSSERGIG